MTCIDRGGFSTYHAAVVWIIDLLAILIRSPQAHLSGSVPGFHAIQIAKVGLVRGEDMRKMAEVLLRHLASSMIYGDFMLKRQIS